MRWFFDVKKSLHETNFIIAGRFSGILVNKHSKLLHGKEKEQMEKGGREWLSKQYLPDRQRILGVYGRLEVLKRGNWTEKARGYGAGYMQTRVKEDSIETLKQFAQNINISTASEDDIRTLGNKINEVFKIDEHLGDKEYTDATEV